MANYETGSEIRIIGPRQSGKTTYLATLVYFPHKQRLALDFPEFIIEPVGSDTRILKNEAHDLLTKGKKLAGTFKQKVEKYPDYSLKIKVPALKNTPKKQIDLVAKDYPGEIFEDLGNTYNSNKMEDYLGDLFKVTGWLIILTDWLPERDYQVYQPAVEKLCHELSIRGRNNSEINKLRVAVMMSKCERGEIWPGRLNPEEDLFAVRLPKTYETLKRRLPRNRLKFFAASSFGILSDRPEDFNPRPNRYVPDDGSPSEYSSYIRDPDQWTPFGLISPIYWLATGRTLPNPKL